MASTSPAYSVSPLMWGWLPAHRIIPVPSWEKQWGISQGSFRPRETLPSLDKVCRGAVPPELGPQLVFHGRSLPMLFLGGAQEPFGSTSLLGIVYSHYWMLKYSCLTLERQRMRLGVGSYGKESFGLLEQKAALENQAQIRRGYGLFRFNMSVAEQCLKII